MKNTRKPIPLEIPKSLQEDAKKIIENAFRLFTENTEDIADELDELDRKLEETRRRISSGASRTTGRIV